MPPDGLVVNEPLACAQVIEVGVKVPAVKAAAGWLMVALVWEEHPFASKTVTVYVAAATLAIVAEVAPLDHE